MGANDWEYLEDIGDLGLYRLYIKNTGKIDKEYYDIMIIYDDPIYYLITNRELNKNIGRLPMELYRYLKDFIY